MDPLNPIHHVAAIISSRPVAVLVLVLVVTLIAAAGIIDPTTGDSRLSLDVSTSTLLPDDDPQGRFYARIRKRFGNDDTMLVVLATEDLFTPERLGRVVSLQERLEALPGVHHVMSLASVTRVRGDDWGIEVSSPLDPIPVEPQALAALRAEARSHPLWGGSLVSDDGRAAALVVSFGNLDEAEMLESRLPARVAEIAHEEGGDAEVWVTGPAYVKLVLTEGILSDLARVIPAVIIIIVLVLGACFRSRRGIAIPMLTIVVAVVWILGTMGWFGIPMTLVSAILPSLLLTVGFTYAIHVVAAQDIVRDEVRECGREGRRAVAAMAIDEVGVAVVITGVTTAIGFASLLLSPIVAIRQFGVLAAVGVLYTIVTSLTLAPALLAVLPEPPQSRRPREHAHARWLDALARHLAGFVVRHRGVVLGTAGLVLVVAVGGVLQVRTGMDPLASFREDSRVRRDHAAISEQFGGVSPLSVVLTSDDRGTFARPEILREVGALQAWLQDDPEIGSVVSVVDLLRMLNAAALGVRVEDAGLPASRATSRQLLLLAAGPEQRALIDAQQKSVRMLVRARGRDSGAIARLSDRIEVRLAQLPSGIRGSVTGNFVLLSRAGAALARGQFHSLVAAVGVIFAVMAMMFMSLRMGLAAFLPNVLPIAVFFGVLGWGGIPLNPATGLIACMALGIGVDSTIHYFARFNADSRRWACEKRATVSALQGVIQPVSYTTIGLCLGFSALALGELRDHAEFGLLAALTLAVAWVVMVTVTPALCAGLKVVTLWDVATLRLGAEPQWSVPLLEGLSARQARRLVHICELHFLAAEERLFAADEVCTQTYIVLEGELVAWVNHDFRRIIVGKLGRGDFVGVPVEDGAALGTHVDALTDVRLLRVSGGALDRLRSRHPEVAERIYQNLARIRAGREGAIEPKA